MTPLALGSLSVWPPVVLAPMAGVTNAPFRRLCRRYGAGLYVSEMVLADALLHGSARTARMVTFDADESRVAGDAALDALAGEAMVDLLRQPADGVTLRHPARCSAASPRRRCR